jgi:hypothetical protein
MMEVDQFSALLVDGTGISDVYIGRCSKIAKSNALREEEGVREQAEENAK